MIQGTTPTYVLFVSNADLTEQRVYVTICGKRSQKVTLAGDRLMIKKSGNGSSVSFRLTQQETLKFPVGDAEVQIRFIDADGEAKATSIGSLRIERVLDPVPIAYQ